MKKFNNSVIIDSDENTQIINKLLKSNTDPDTFKLIIDDYINNINIDVDKKRNKVPRNPLYILSRIYNLVNEYKSNFIEKVKDLDEFEDMVNERVKNLDLILDNLNIDIGRGFNTAIDKLYDSLLEIIDKKDLSSGIYSFNVSVLTSIESEYKIRLRYCKKIDLLSFDAVLKMAYTSTSYYYCFPLLNDKDRRVLYFSIFNNKFSISNNLKYLNLLEDLIDNMDECDFEKIKDLENM